MEPVRDWSENLRGQDVATVSLQKSAVLSRVDGQLHALPQLSATASNVDEWQAYFENGWALTESQFSGVREERGFYRPPYHNLRHPLVFYLGHSASVYVNKLRCAGLLGAAVNDEFERIFEVGVDEMRWDDMHKNHCRWPSISSVYEYRQQVFDAVSDAIRRHGGDASDGGRVRPMDTPSWALLMGMEHERIHLETSSVLIRELPIDLVAKPPSWPDSYPLEPRQPPPGGGGEPRSAPVAGGSVTLGKSRDFPTFGWDNEYGALTMHVNHFEATRDLITNAQFYEFVLDGGYTSQRIWCADGWSWRTFRNVRKPTFWVADGPAGLNEYRLRLCYEEVPMQWQWPAEVNAYEARAYCNWLAERHSKKPGSYRLPTEAELAVLEHGAGSDATALRELADDATTHHSAAPSANTALRYGSPSPVGVANRTPAGFGDVRGNVWQWLEDHCCALPGFQTHAYYDDFSLPCFDAQHLRIGGNGSFASAGNLASRFARYHFRPHFYQHAGFRVVSTQHRLDTTCMHTEGPFVGDASPFRCPTPSAAQSAAKYDLDVVLQAYLHMHFAPPEEHASFAPHSSLRFPQRCAELLVEQCVSAAAVHDERGHSPLVHRCGDDEHEHGAHRALDIGCAVGGSSFELARHFERVDALDISANFIDAADRVKQSGRAEYSVRVEGELFADGEVALDDAIDRSRVHFSVGDATDLGHLAAHPYDAVLVANVICRLPDSSGFFAVLPTLVKRNGIVALTTPFSWLEQFTPRQHWLGGYTDAKTGRNVDSKATLIERMRALGFRLIDERDMPFSIHEHSRKCELVNALATVFQKV
jgi:5-histidylcysteine sulfoxide synthase/putative 4-mercaptohistidine N1-methyltranferase